MAGLQVVVLLFPNVTQLDFTGPAQVFSRLPGTSVHLAWHDTEPVRTDCGWSIVPTTTLSLGFAGDAGRLERVQHAARRLQESL